MIQDCIRPAAAARQEQKSEDRIRAKTAARSAAAGARKGGTGLLRRFAPRNDGQATLTPALPHRGGGKGTGADYLSA
jgi:hypothetical protein